MTFEEFKKIWMDYIVKMAPVMYQDYLEKRQKYLESIGIKIDVRSNSGDVGTLERDTK